MRHGGSPLPPDNNMRGEPTKPFEDKYMCTYKSYLYKLDRESGGLLFRATDFASGIPLSRLESLGGYLSGDRCSGGLLPWAILDLEFHSSSSNLWGSTLWGRLSGGLLSTSGFGYPFPNWSGGPLELSFSLYGICNIWGRLSGSCYTHTCMFLRNNISC